jgi:hypothetical protein
LSRIKTRELSFQANFRPECNRSNRHYTELSGQRVPTFNNPNAFIHSAC